MKKNVCFLLGGFESGGIGRVVSILANKINEDNNDYNISVITITKDNKPIYKLNNKIKQDVLLDSYTSMRKSLFKSIIGLNKYLKKNNIDILIACGNIFYLPSIVAAVGKKTKVICWEHSNIYNTKDNYGQKFNRFIAKIGADKIVTLTDSDRYGFENMLKARNVTRIYNPIDPRLNENKKEYNSKSKKIITIGRLCYQKQIDIIPDIAKDIFDKYPDWSWDIYGSGEEENKVSNLIISKGLEKKVNLKGQVNDLYERYSDYSFIVMTSRYEGFPMTLLEASANRLPMISFDIATGPNEIIENNISGYLIEPFNSEMLKEKILKLIKNEEHRKIMSKKSFMNVQRFKVESIIIQWYELFESLLK